MAGLSLSIIMFLSFFFFSMYNDVIIFSLTLEEEDEEHGNSVKIEITRQCYTCFTGFS